MNRRRGAILVLTALALAALLAVAALAVDLGVLSLARQRAQDQADAAALAGGARLPDTGAALSAADGVIAANGQNGGTFLADAVTTPTSITRDDGTTLTVGPGDAILVQGHMTTPLAFGPESSRSVAATAAVALQNACGLPAGLGIAPFGLIGDDPNSADPTARYVASLLSTASGAQTPQPNVYQPTTTYGGQPLALRQNVWSGGTLVLAGNFDPLPLPGAAGYQSSVSSVSTAPLAAGQALTPQSSATVALSRSGLGARLAPSDAQFTHDDALSPAYADWFFGNPSDPVDTTRSPVTDPNTGQTYSYHVDPHRQEMTDAHVLILPIVSQSSPGGTGPVTVLAFAAFFVEQPVTSKTSNTIALGRFIGIIAAGADSGTCAGAGLDTPPQLVQ